MGSNDAAEQLAVAIEECARQERIVAELAAVIEAAPHAERCHSRYSVGFPSRAFHDCDCWKSTPPADVLREHDAKLLEDAAEDGYGGSFGVSDWLRARAAAIREGK